MLSLPPDDAPGPAPRCSGECSPSSDTVFGPGPPVRSGGPGQEPGHGAAAVAGDCRRENRGTLFGTRSFTVSVAQKRFSLILALIKVTLWLPMMVKVRLLTVCGCVCQTV